jgi:antitoxin ParD1/3/4
MPTSYALGGYFEKLIDSLIASGRFNSKSEVIREGLRLLDEREKRRKAMAAEIRRLLREGKESGPGVRLEDAMAEIKSRARRRAA